MDADNDQTAMIEPAITAADEEGDYTSQASIIGDEGRGRQELRAVSMDLARCTPPLFFTIAGLLIFFLIGSNLFMFIGANAGNSAGFEATEEPEAPVSTDDEPHIIRRALNDSVADDDVTMVLRNPPDSTKNPTGFRSGPQLLRSRSLVCVLGGRTQEYGPMRLDGLCDVALLPFYALPKGGDTFLNDGDKVTQQVLDMAAKAVKTSYGIHVPFQKLSKVMDDLIRRRAHNKLKNYWIKRNIYHYAILDLGIGPNDTVPSDDAVGKAFGVLKKFKSIQDNIRRALSKNMTKMQRHAYVILGVHLRKAANMELFKALEHHVLSFPISGLIVRTHITQREALNFFNGCSIAGPTPYKINNSQAMGMASVVPYAKKFARARHTPLVISFTLCTRQYRSNKELRIDAKCSKNATTMATSSSICSEKPGFYGNQAIDKTQHTAYSWKKPDLVATYDTADTMKWKASIKSARVLVCSLERKHRPLNLSVALFDVECDDWRDKCTKPSASHMKGSERTRSLRAYLRRLSRRGSKRDGGDDCP
ncbi:hypothetical protein HPB50_008736 [Hyalomma asiaticum]|uniref:Uncharacterized protein n=1 Tax=Hyalomma asiaticum TaxID=266040 RepID=A0ACB7SFH7_HYAAI|nr:hypothetical protein HPB50_008736 [Hyalomma asiaticum]